jgi:hypothetical protein
MNVPGGGPLVRMANRGYAAGLGFTGGALVANPNRALMGGGMAYRQPRTVLNNAVGAATLGAVGAMAAIDMMALRGMLNPYMVGQQICPLCSQMVVAQEYVQTVDTCICMNCGAMYEQYYNDIMVG